jgi:hypothetical protein
MVCLGASTMGKDKSEETEQLYKRKYHRRRQGIKYARLMPPNHAMTQSDAAKFGHHALTHHLTT